LMCNCTSENPFLRRVCGVMDSGFSPAGCPGMTKGCLTFESESDRLFSPIARELICWRGAPRAPTSPCASELSDPGQGARMAPSDNLAMEWKPIITAPFDRDLSLPSSITTAPMRSRFHVAVFSTAGSMPRPKSCSIICGRHTGASGNYQPGKCQTRIYN